MTGGYSRASVECHIVMFDRLLASKSASPVHCCVVAAIEIFSRATLVSRAPTDSKVDAITARCHVGVGSARKG
jgi:hypothetical protein